jgi:hypothetical protein
METRYLLTVMWRRLCEARIYCIVGSLPTKKWGEWQYLTCIHYSPTQYLLENWDGQMEVEHVILNSHQISEAEYALLRDETTIEDFTR